MRTARKALLATSLAVAFALAGTAAATTAPTETTPALSRIPTASYPWVQPPAWVGAPIVTAPGSGYVWVQPPAWIPIA